ncbi:limonene-1,2-epoxide hydrolase family protein [Gordonia insulae]|uniref:Epoxide hydrolase EphG n=1 Tax=Gordonia insulae TaxID=2420509 RepID=A0A3G8JL28_9ACTN|nr:limonene-1,2-epoxide hydrolase family protein [Gordonia insulae]AZG45139.1 Epoxide hydrolase EphG [Gordonia insulae]
MTSQTPIDIVTEFLDDLARGNVAAALDDLDEHIAYTNVSTPTVHGKRKVAKIFGGMDKLSWAGFNYRMVNVSSDGPVVLTERVDELRMGPVVMQFWVCGRFEVAEGRITVWRDYFDYFDMAKGLIRGLLAAVIPAVQKPLPAKAVAG